MECPVLHVPYCTLTLPFLVLDVATVSSCYCLGTCTVYIRGTTNCTFIVTPLQIDESSHEKYQIAKFCLDYSDSFTLQCLRNYFPNHHIKGFFPIQFSCSISKLRMKLFLARNNLLRRGPQPAKVKRERERGRAKGCIYATRNSTMRYYGGDFVSVTFHPSVRGIILKMFRLHSSNRSLSQSQSYLVAESNSLNLE